MENNNKHIDYKEAYESSDLLVKQYEASLEKSQSKIEALEYELKQLKKLFLGKKAERFVASNKDDTAPTLFDVPVIEELSPAQVKVISYEKTITKKQASKHQGRNAFPEGLRREEIIINPSAIDITFAKKIGEDITEVLSFIPAELYVKRIVRTKYQDLTTGIIHQEAAPSRGFERSKVDVTIPSQLIVSKYVDHLPLDRQIKMFARLGLTISDSSVNNWINAVGYFLTPLYEKHKELVLNSDYLHADETTIRGWIVIRKELRIRGIIGCINHISTNWYFLSTKKVEDVRVPVRCLNILEVFYKQMATKLMKSLVNRMVLY